MIEIIAVKTDIGYFIQSKTRGLHGLLFDGQEPEKTFNTSWYKISDEPKKVTILKSQPNINHRFVLDEHAPGKDELPQEMPKHEVMEEDDDGYCGWKPEFRHLQSLYHEVSDPQDPIEEEVEFEFNILCYVPEIKTADLTYNLAGRYTSDPPTVFNAGRIHHQILDTILFPDVVMPNLPCKLSSKDTFNIIRNHVNSYIDGRYAKVTSNYEFCFTVKKRIPLATTIYRKQEIKKNNGRSYAKPRYREWTITHREIEVFEMAPAPYRGYTVITPFEGTDHQDLRKNIDTYLENLMARINEPLVDCPHCNGLGVVNEEKINHPK